MVIVPLHGEAGSGQQLGTGEQTLDAELALGQGNGLPDGLEMELVHRAQDPEHMRLDEVGERQPRVRLRGARDDRTEGGVVRLAPVLLAYRPGPESLRVIRRRLRIEEHQVQARRRQLPHPVNRRLPVQEASVLEIDVAATGLRQVEKLQEPTPRVEVSGPSRPVEPLLESYRSSGVRPVRFAILASMRGPISSRSWNANTKSGHPGRSSVRCDPVCRLIAHPMRSSAASTRLARVLGQAVTPPGTRCSGGQG